MVSICICYAFVFYMTINEDMNVWQPATDQCVWLWTWVSMFLVMNLGLNVFGYEPGLNVFGYEPGSQCVWLWTWLNVFGYEPGSQCVWLWTWVSVFLVMNLGLNVFGYELGSQCVWLWTWVSMCLVMNLGLNVYEPGLNVFGLGLNVFGYVPGSNGDGAINSKSWVINHIQWVRPQIKIWEITSTTVSTTVWLSVP